VTEPFVRVATCHCTSCKLLSGGGGTVSGRARSDSIRILQGQDLLRTYQPAEGSAKTFCSECGSNLFGAGWPESEYSAVRLPTLDSFDGKPTMHIYVRSVAAWESLPDDGTDRYETHAP
jgi:hypothetical protein